MPVTLTIRDETMAPGGEDHVFELEVPSESITVRELIRERVYQEVDDHNRAVRSNAQTTPAFRGLVQPSGAGQSSKATSSREVDWKKQFDLAIDAFEHKRMLVLVGDHQASSLDETIEITPSTEVTFLRLVLLVGG